MTKYSSSIEDLLDDNKDDQSPKGAEEKLSQTIEDIDLKKKEQIAKEQATSANLSYINLEGFPISQEALSMMTEEDARQHKAIVFLFNSDELRLATTDISQPGIAELLKRLSEKHHARTKLYLTSEHSYEIAMKLYARLPQIKEVERGVTITEEDLKKHTGQIKDFRQIEEKLRIASISEMVVIIIAGAIDSRASDVHIEAEENDVKIRYRIDGVLLEVATLKKEIWAKLVARLKLLARLKLNIVDVPQDGRFTIHLKEEKIDVRVSSLPTAFGRC